MPRAPKKECAKTYQEQVDASTKGQKAEAGGGFRTTFHLTFDIDHLSFGDERVPYSQACKAPANKFVNNLTDRMNRPTTSQSRADELEERLIDFAVRVVSIWLRVIERGQLIKADSLNDIMRENKELCRIFNASLKNNGRKHEGKLINVRLQMTKGGFNYEVQL